MGITASRIQYRVGSSDIVVAEFPPVFVAHHVILTPEKMKRRRFERSGMRDLRFDRERILLCHPFKNGLVRATESRKYIPGECGKRGLALNDGHLFVVIPRPASQSQNGGVLSDNLPTGQDARLMGRLVHYSKSSQPKDLISTLVSDVPGNHASKGITYHRYLSNHDQKLQA